MATLDRAGEVVTRRKRASVYYAEDRVFFGSRHSIPIGMITMREVAARYTDATIEYRPRVKGGDTGAQFHVDRGDGRGARILMGRDAGLYVLLHEIAHAQTFLVDRGHGGAWRVAYVKLVEVEMSKWWARRLRASFRWRGDDEEF